MRFTLLGPAPGALALRLALLLTFSLTAPTLVHAQPAADPIVEAREALRKRDKARLAALRQSTVAAAHPLAQWVEYWELSNRLSEAQQPELDAFYTRWPSTYVEDRLRNDWLLELGRRRDWANFSRDLPAYRMKDDREVACYQMLVQHQAGVDVREAARAAWLAQREADDGCTLLATTLYQAGKLKADDAWLEARLSLEANRPRAARVAAALVDETAASTVAEIFENPARVLKRLEKEKLSGTRAELAVLALMRSAYNDPEYAAAQLNGHFSKQLPADKAAYAWAYTGKAAALKQQPEAADHFVRAFQLLGKKDTAQVWPDETLGWAVRAALRLPAAQTDRWSLVQRAIAAMSPNEQADATWVYWKARATAARAATGEAGDADRQAARNALEAVAAQQGFYAKLAGEELGRKFTPPAAAAALSEAERSAPRSVPGFKRALQLIQLGLRNEGVREWNWMLRGLNDRELIAAAQLACDNQVWDRCINTSERSKTEIDMAQRFPTPLRDEVMAKAREVGVDPAYVFGLIRQESRFIMDTRSHVGASGLMQLMPATARWTAKRIGVPYKPELITDRDLNLLLGTTYLKLVLDDFGGSQALAAAAYNAGPSRPRRWREGVLMEPAAWAETIPFNETRDYVKKVLSNAVDYAHVLGQAVPSLKARLGGPVGPRDPNAAAPDTKLP
jgi:soluble lytic murein transglycosylase